MKRRKQTYYPQVQIGGAWEPLLRTWEEPGDREWEMRTRSEEVVCSTLSGAKHALRRKHPVTFGRAERATVASEVGLRVLDHMGEVVWPDLIRGRP